MIENIVISIVLMVVELFIIIRWLKSRDEKREQIAWTPFRKMMLDSVIEHTDDLLATANKFEHEIDEALNQIKRDQVLSLETKSAVDRSIADAELAVQKSRERFFYALQTVAPSLQPYAAQYCNEVLWFGSALLRSLGKSRAYLGEIDDARIQDNSATSRPLNGVSAMLMSIEMFREFRFGQFKKNFTQSVWKNEGLHYFEPDNEFLPPDDYKAALDTEKSTKELRNIPRTMPVKSFFDLSE